MSKPEESTVQYAVVSSAQNKFSQEEGPWAKAERPLRSSELTLVTCGCLFSLGPLPDQDILRN